VREDFIENKSISLLIYIFEIQFNPTNTRLGSIIMDVFFAIAKNNLNQNKHVLGSNLE